MPQPHVTFSILLTTAPECEALAQFLKRVGWSEVRQNAIDDEEARLMQSALDKVRAALNEIGYNPR